MKELDKKEIIDYCPPNLTTLDVKEKAYPIYFCPFCGKEIIGCKKFVKKLKKQFKEIKEGKIKTIPLKELKEKLIEYEKKHPIKVKKPKKKKK